MSTLDRIRTLGNAMIGRVDADVLEDALEWLDHHELDLALEVLADKVFDSKTTITEGEYAEFVDLAHQIGLDFERVGFLRRDLGPANPEP